MQKLWCSKLLKHYNKKGWIIRRFLLFLFPYICFLFESVKLISFLQDSIRYLHAQMCWNISTFFKNFYPFQNFSCSTSLFLIFYLAPKEFFSWTKPIIPVAQNGRNITWKCFEIVCSIIVPQWRHKKLLFIWSTSISTDWEYQNIWSKWSKYFDLRTLTNSWHPDSNWEPLVSKCKSLTTKACKN